MLAHARCSGANRTESREIKEAPLTPGGSARIRDRMTADSRLSINFPASQLPVIQEHLGHFTVATLQTFVKSDLSN